MLGSFETPASKLFVSLPKQECRNEKCESTNIECLWHDWVWEETCYRCKDCGREWIKG